MAATKINLTHACTLVALMRYGVVPTKIFQHENLSYESFIMFTKISRSMVICVLLKGDVLISEIDISLAYAFEKCSHFMGILFCIHSLCNWGNVS